MRAYRKSNYVLITMSAALLVTGMAWSDSPADGERAADRESDVSAVSTSDEVKAIDQDGNLVTLPAAADVQPETTREPRVDAVDPKPVDQDDHAVAADEPLDESASPKQAPILDAASSQFSFQALLTDAAGDPLPGPNVELVFRIYDGGGVQLGDPIGPFVVPISNGIVDTQVPVLPKLFNGTEREMGVVVNRGAELTPRVKLVAVPYALRVDRVTSQELDDTIDLGADNANGQLRIWSNAANLRSIILQGSNHTVALIGTDGTSNAVLDGEPYGELRMRDETGNDLTVVLSATANSGGELTLTGAAGVANIFADGGTGIVDAEDGFRIVDAIPFNDNEVMRAFRFSTSVGGAQLRFRDGAGVDQLNGGTSTNGGGFWNAKQSDGSNGVIVTGDAVDGGGRVRVFDVQANLTIDLDGVNHRIDLTANNGEERARLAGGLTGSLSLYDGNGFLGNDNSVRTAIMSAGPNTIVGLVGPGNDFGGQITLDDSDGTAAIYMNGGNNTGLGTRVATTGSHQVLSSITATATVLGSLGPGSNGGADLTLRAADGSTSIFLDGDSGGAGLINLRDAGGLIRVQLDGSGTGTGGEISVHDGSGTETIELLGSESSSGEASGQIMVRKSDGTDRIEIDADGSSGARIQVLQNDGSSGIVLDGQSDNGSMFRIFQNDGDLAIIMEGEPLNSGGRIRVRNAANASRVFIDGDYNGTGLGRIRADIVRVQGGVDLAEPFECKDKDKAQPGTVMSIDPNSPGKLMMSTEAYDRKVAGIISGAGGIRPGITLSQDGVMDQGPLVALTGRVYCMADASNGAIQPGDLLTTSNAPGHAMKVSDYGRAQGAIIGKAMTPLKAGNGLVLVLVQPQ